MSVKARLVSLLIVVLLLKVCYQLIVTMVFLDIASRWSLSCIWER